MSDAVLLVSFGGPEGPADVGPFLQNVTRGRDIPPARLAKVAEQYEMFGGVSPLNAHCRALRAAIERDFAEHRLKLPVYWGNRNWRPYLAETLRQMVADGVTRAFAFITSPYSSYSSCRQYLDDIEMARADVGSAAPVVQRLRHYFNHPGFIEPIARRLNETLDSLGDGRTDIAIVFTAHSIPLAMAATCDYQAQLAEVMNLVIGRISQPVTTAALVYQSRSGPPQMPWLEPDINAHLATLAAQGLGTVVTVPIGFISDHMEVVYDLDTVAAATAAEHGLRWRRVPTIGNDAAFVGLVRDLTNEALGVSATSAALGRLGPRSPCLPGCCPAR